MSAFTRIFSQNAERDHLIGRAYAAVIEHETAARDRCVARLISRHAQDPVAGECVIDLIQQVSSRGREEGIHFAAHAASLACEQVEKAFGKIVKSGGVLDDIGNDYKAICDLRLAVLASLEECVIRHSDVKSRQKSADVLDVELVAPNHSREVRETILRIATSIRKPFPGQV